MKWATVTNRKKGSHTDPLRKSDPEALNEAVRRLDVEREHVESDRQDPYDPWRCTTTSIEPLSTFDARAGAASRNNPYEVYQDALDHGGADFKRFFIWFRNRRP